MDFKILDEQVSVSAEPSLQQFSALADSGVEVVVCNRAEHEVEGIPEYSEMKQAAADAGMTLVAIPFSPGKMQPEHCQQFSEVLQSGKRIHAFCRSGNRACNLWAAARCTEGADKRALQSAARNAGYDVSGVLVSF